MADLKFKPIPHNHEAFQARARTRPGFTEAYDALELKYQQAGQMLKARSNAGPTQDAVCSMDSSRDDCGES